MNLGTGMVFELLQSWANLATNKVVVIGNILSDLR
jgi:hypothetical protein